MANCNICKTPMTEHESFRMDCGGDCLLCMAEIGDDACIAKVLRLARTVRVPISEKLMLEIRRYLSARRAARNVP